MIRYFKNWTTFEIFLLVSSTLAIIILSIPWQHLIDFISHEVPSGKSSISWQDMINFISVVTGVIAVVLGAKGKISTYAFATVNVSLYAYIARQDQLYGEVMLNTFYYLPMNLVGFLLWKDHKSSVGEVQTRSLSLQGLIVMLSSAILGTLLYWRLLLYWDGNLTLLDSASTILSIIALILQVTRFTEAWLLWILVNIVTISIWYLILLQGNSQTPPAMLVMWGTYLINSVYGYWHWKKVSHKKTSN